MSELATHAIYNRTSRERSALYIPEPHFHSVAYHAPWFPPGSPRPGRYRRPAVAGATQWHCLRGPKKAADFWSAA